MLSTFVSYVNSPIRRLLSNIVLVTKIFFYTTAKISLHVHHNHNVLLTFGPSYMLAIITDGNASGEKFT